jgi:hypothetical protein
MMPLLDMMGSYRQCTLPVLVPTNNWFSLGDQSMATTDPVEKPIWCACCSVAVL